MTPTIIKNATLYNCDCMELMKQYPDNHFDLAIVDPPYGININNQSQGKGGGIAKKNEYAKSELAYTSFKTAVRNFRFQWAGMLQGDMKNKEVRIHPTQKPVKLYEWLLTNYAKQGDKILDTHLGSGSHAIACNNLGFELTACELDEDYFKASVERIKREAQQERLF